MLPSENVSCSWDQPLLPAHPVHTVHGQSIADHGSEFDPVHAVHTEHLASHAAGSAVHAAEFLAVHAAEYLTVHAAESAVHAAEPLAVHAKPPSWRLQFTSLPGNITCR